MHPNPRQSPVFSLARWVCCCLALAVLAVLLAGPARAQVISTVAGTGTLGSGGDGGPATSAMLNTPRGVAVDGAGNLFIADFLNNRIRKVNASGVISTIAGSGAPGFAGNGGPATSALLNNPAGVAVDGAGNLFIADQANRRIRKVNPSGVISTVAGNGVPGFGGDGGAATSAQLDSPVAVAVDSAGNLYIADFARDRIRKVNASGVISTIAGTGTAGFGGDGGSAASARLNSPAGVAVDSAGNLFIADYGNNRIRKVSPNGAINTVAGNGVTGFYGDGGAATSARLDKPSGVAVDSAGNLFIADYGNNRIRKVNASGVISTIAGNGALGYAGDGDAAIAARLFAPYGVSVDSAGDVFIADTGNRRIRKVSIAPPGAPTDVVATAGAPGSGTITVSWSPPASDGGSPITSYEVGTGLCTATAPATSCVITGLPNGASHSFAVRATNSAGNGPYSALSSPAVLMGVQAISFGLQASQTYTNGGTSPISPLAIASSGLQVTYSSLTNSVCTVVGSTVTIQSVGTCTLAADQGGNSSWAAAPQVTQNVAIGQGLNTISFGAQASQTYSSGGTFPISPTATASSGLQVTYSSLTTSVCTVSGQAVNILSGGTCTLAANQGGNANWAAAAQATQNVVIAPAANTISFAHPGAQAVGTPLVLSASASSGLPVAFAVSGDCSLSGNTVSFANPGSCTVTASQAGDANWAAAPDVSHNLAVVQRSRSLAVPGGLASVSFTGGGATCSFESLVAASPATSGPTQPPANLVFDHGLLDFVLSGCDQSDVQMTVVYPQPLAQGTAYWKLQAGNWAAYPAQVDEAAGTVRFTLRDGGAGDDDGVADGRIVDPSGAAHLAAATPVPTLGQWALMVLTLLLGLLGVGKFKAKSRPSACQAGARSY